LVYFLFPVLVMTTATLYWQYLSANLSIYLEQIREH